MAEKRDPPPAPARQGSVLGEHRAAPQLARVEVRGLAGAAAIDAARGDDPLDERVLRHTELRRVPPIRRAPSPSDGPAWTGSRADPAADRLSRRIMARYFEAVS